MPNHTKKKHIFGLIYYKIIKQIKKKMEFNSRKRKRKIEDETSSDNDIKMEESKSEQSRLLKEFIELGKINILYFL